MPYVNIPDSGLGGATAKIVGKIQGEIASKVMSKVSDIVNKLNTDGCPSNRELTRIRNKVNKLLSVLSSVDSKLAKFRALPSKLKAPVSGLKAALNIILILPIPQAVPPGIGLPVNITTKYADLMHLIKELIKQADELIQSIEVVLETPSSNLKSLDRLLANADSALRACELEKALNEQITEGLITEQELENLGLYRKGRLTISTLGAKLFASTEDLSQTVVAQSTGNSSSSTRNRGKWTLGFDYLENDIVSLDKVKYICIQDHKASNTNRPPSSYWSTLDNATQDSVKSLVDSLDKIDKSNISQESKSQLKQILDTFKDTESATQQTDPDYYYTTPDNQILTIKIITDPASPQIAPKRYAQAINANGGIVLTGPKSFSSDAKVLIDEIKFRLDNQLS